MAEARLKALPQHFPSPRMWGIEEGALWEGGSVNNQPHL